MYQTIQLAAESSGSGIFSNLGSLLSGVSEVLLALGAALGFFIRNRKNAQREKLRAETAASVAAQETKRTLEEKLDKQYAAQIAQYEAQLASQNQAHTLQVDQLKAQIEDLQTVNSHLIERILGGKP